MKKKKIIKTIVLILFILIVVFFLYNFVNSFRFGKQIISIDTSTQIYSDSNIEAIIDVKDKKDNSLKSNVKVELFDSDGKKVKNVQGKYQKSETEKINALIPLTEDIETGKYELKVTSKYKLGFFKDYIDVPVNIIKGSETKTIISLDKGIYKPGDEINFRALLISKRDDTPTQTNAKIYIYDGNDNKVYSNETKTSEYGIVSGNFKIADEVNSGTYKLVISTDNSEVTKEFTVNPYITPQFEVSVVSDKENYIIGENANITISAKYFFGEPVKNATVKGKINETEIQGITGADGNFSTKYVVTKDGTIDIKLNVTDSSNYLIETEKTLYVSEDLFKIEVLPEYGDLVKGVDNEVYVFTRAINGKGLKTQSTVRIGNVVRQVITDDNGIGSFTLTSSDMQSINTSNMQITSEDAEGRKVEKVEEINIIVSKGVLINTDKIKYNCGDDINVALDSNVDLQSKEIYFYKGNELLKVVSSENNDFAVNLEGISGLVDIYVKNSNSVTYASKYLTPNLYSKKTIFIKPNKNLNIAISTDSEEYAPGDKLNISFNTTDEKNNQMDSALLVSILDKAILNLAENDLSIDNIKIALEDIELSNGITAADLYTNIIDDSSESLLKSLLLKQEYTDPKIYSKTVSTSHNDIDEYKERAGISFLIIVVVLIGFGLIKASKNEKKGSKLSLAIAHIINFIVIYFFTLLVLYEPVDDLFYQMTSKYNEVFTLLTNAVLTAVLYMLVLYKQRDYIFELIINLLAIPTIYVFILAIITSFFEAQDLILVFAMLALLAIWAVLVCISRNKKLAPKVSFLKHSLTQFFKGVILFIAGMIVSEGLNSGVGIFLVLLVYILLDKYAFGKTKIKLESKQINLNISGNELITAGVGILFIVILFTGIRSIVSNFASTDLSLSEQHIQKNHSKELIMGTYSGNINDSDMLEVQPAYQSKEDSSGFTNFKTITERNDVTESINEQAQEIEKTEEKVENIRNIFLESLAFIPELVTQNGNANLALDISDNITTWNIQTVGNSKQGNIGYSSKSFKVFKEFFVDYTLPTNSVVSDKVEIPVTLYNYTQDNLSIEVNIKENDWCKIGTYDKTVNVPANSTQMIYVPIEIIKSGKNTLRIETKSGNISDIVEKNLTISENGLEIQSVVSSGSMQKNLSQDIIYSEKAIEGTKNLKVKLYASSMVQVIENIDAMLQLPTGCFEQTSSSLYPDVLVLKYLNENKLDNPEIKAKALDYISTGYQKLLTYEVNGTKGGYSLYGRSPAEPVITAFGLMEMKEISDVYEIDEKVIENMKEYLFDVQKVNGSFDYKSTYIGSATSTDELAMNAYIVWALSEVFPDDSRLDKSVRYLENKIEDANDNYTLALMANIFENINDKTNANKVISKLLENIVTTEDSAYVISKIRDYYGSCGTRQNIQTTALTSMALTKSNSNSKTNEAFINYLIQSKYENGTWGSTQSTVLALKAINSFEKDSDISNQTITVKVNGEAKSVDMDKNSLDLYEFDFNNLPEENKISIEMKKGKISYEIIKEYYRDYDDVQFEQDLQSSSKLIIEQTITQSAKVNDTITQKIHVVNRTNDYVSNGLVQINIPQGCSVNEESLMLLEHNNIIEKYEYSYGKINLYLRDFKNGDEKDFQITYRALYPETVTGGAIRFYDYYNPEIEAISKPNQISVSR